MTDILSATVRANSEDAQREARNQALPGEPIRPRADIQAVFEVLRRGGASEGRESDFRIDLSRAFLKGADLTWIRLRGASLIEADLRDSYLQDSDLNKAKLDRAKLGRARLARACLDGADLKGARLEKAHLQKVSLVKADLRGAVLSGANLWRARLEGADLSFADLRRTNLRGANLLGAKGLTGSQLQDTITDKDTRLPSDLALERKPVIVEDAAQTGFYFRPGTMDETIFQMVVRHNEYGLPASFQAGDVIIDLGAHIGAFTYACLTRGAGRVYAIEATQENFELLRRNLVPFRNRVEAMHGAAWRSDVTEETKLKYPDFPVFAGALNTGGVGVAFGGKHEVQAVPFDRIVHLASDDGQRRIRLLKLDVEGSEWPILLTSKSLPWVDAVCGEFHEIGGPFDSHTLPFTIRGYSRFTMVELDRFLVDEGFRVTHRRYTNQDGSPSHMGLFSANRAP